MRKRWLSRRLVHKVVVHTTDDRSIRGLLVFVGRSDIALKFAHALGPEGAVELAGTVCIENSKVSLVQVLDPVQEGS